MRGFRKQIGSFLMAAAFLCLAGVAGCAARGQVRFYDPVYGDYHYWNRAEITYYQQWESDTHRRDEDFDRRSRQEQDEYWRWRHQHEGGGQNQH